MVISHNLAAMNASRQMNIVTGRKQKSMEKLSSGYRINRAADDAAGLSISEKMRKQIRGLNRGAENIQDGISLVQVADGALNETQDILQRMRVLSIQGANDTNSKSDRQAIQNEMDELTDEVDRIAETTSFNQSIFPLKGDVKKITETRKDVILPFPVKEVSQLVSGYNYRYSKVFVNGEDATSSQNCRLLKGLEVAETGGSLWSDSGACEEVNPIYSEGSWRLSGGQTDADGNFQLFDLTLDDLKVDENGYVYYNSKFVQPAKQYLLLEVNTSGKYLEGWGSINNLVPSLHPIKGNTVEKTLISKIEHSKSVWIQMGADPLDGLCIGTCNATADALGLRDPNVDVSSWENCMDTINRIDSAFEKVSKFRSYFGAMQNRLEHGVKINENTSENTQAAESRIRDTDMANEVMNNAKQSILLQAGQAMIVQANQQPQSVLSLLQ